MSYVSVMLSLSCLHLVAHCTDYTPCHGTGTVSEGSEGPQQEDKKQAGRLEGSPAGAAAATEDRGCHAEEDFGS